MIPLLGVINATNITSIQIPDIVNLVVTNPKIAVAIGIQILLGFGLGYVMSKMIKYVIALICVLIIGSMLSVWSLGDSVETVITNVRSKFYEMIPLIKNLLLTLGLLTVGPVTLGFILGIIVGLIKK